jgi:hypothetical protein
MTWVKEAMRSAESSAIRAAENFARAEADRAAFAAEDTSTEAIQDFLEPLIVPIKQVVVDLREAGFTVTESGLESLYFDDAEGKKDVKSVLKQYTSSGLGTDYRGSTDYPVTVINLTGMQWNIRHPDGGALCTIRLYPRANDVTHFAGIEVCILGSDFSTVVAPTDNLGIMRYMLQEELKRQIEKYTVRKSMHVPNKQRS